MRSRRGRLSGCLGIGVIAVVLGAGGLVGFGAWLGTGGGNRWLERRIEGFVSGRTEGGSLEIGRLGLGRGGILLDDVVLADADGHPLVSAGRVVADVDWRALFDRRLVLPRLRGEAVVVEVAADAEGVLDLSRLFGGPSPTPSTEPFRLPLPIELPDVVLTGVSFRYATPTGTAFELVGADLRGSVAGEGSVVAVERLAGTGQIAAPGPVAVRLGGGVVWDGEQGLELSELLLEVPHGSVTANGTVGEVWDLGVRVERLEARALDPIAGDAGIGGVWVGSVSARGPKDQLALVAAMRGVERTETAGTVTLAMDLDLSQPATVWSGKLALADFAVQQLYTPLAQPVVLDGVVDAHGVGFAFPDMTASGTWKGGEMNLYGQDVDALDAAFSLADGKLVLDRGSVDGIIGQLEIGGEIDLQRGPLALTVDGTLSPERLAALGTAGLDGDGRISALITTDLQAEQVVTRIEGTARYGPFLYADGSVRIDQLVANYTATVAGGDVRGKTDLSGRGVLLYGVTAETLRADGLSFVRRADGRTTVEGDLGLASAAFTDNVTIGDAVTTLWFEMQGAHKTANATVALTDYTLLGRPGTDGAVMAQVRDDDVRFQVDLLDYGRTVLATDGGYSLPTGRVTIESFAFAPTPRTTWENDGPWRMTVVEGGLADASISARSDLGRVELEGRVGTVGPLSGDLRLRAFQLDHLAEMYPDSLDGLAGTLDLDLALSGTAERPVLDGEVGLVGLFANDSVRWLDVDGPFHLADEVLEPRLSVAVAGEPLGFLGGRIPVTGGLAAPALDTEAPAAVRVDLVPGTLQRLANAATSLDETELPIGRASGTISLDGPLRDPDLRIAGVAELAVPGWVEPGRVELDVHRKGDAMDVIADLREGYATRATVAGGGTTRLAEVFAWVVGGEVAPDTSDLALYLDDLTLAVALAGVPTSSLAAVADLPVSVDGDLVGGFVITGSPTRPVVDGAVNWLDPEIGRQPLEGGYLSLVPGDGGYALDASITTSDGGGLGVSGAVPVTIDLEAEDWTQWSTGDLALTMGGPGLPLSLLSGFVEGVTAASGRAQITGDVVGTLADPRPELIAAIRDGYVRYAPHGIDFEDIQLTVRASRDAAALDLAYSPIPSRRFGRELREVTGKPMVRVVGTTDLESWTPVNEQARIELSDAWLVSTDTAKARVSGSLQVADNAVTGKLTTEQARYAPESFAADAAPLEIDPALRIVRGVEVPVEVVAVEPSWYADYRADVTVDLRRNLDVQLQIPFVDDFGALGAMVSSADVVARVGGEVQLVVEDGEPSLVGEVDLVEGNVRLLRSSFDLVQGSTVTWAGGDPFEDANLNIDAEMSVDSATLRATIRGTPPEPEFTLSSEEFPDPTEQMTILLTGRSPEDLTSEQGAGAAGALAGLFASSVLGPSLGSISIEPDGSVRLGVPITADVFASTTVAPTTDPNTNSLTFQAEWSVFDHVIMSGALGDRVSSGDIYWELRF